jgi:hypothetical protein
MFRRLLRAIFRGIFKPNFLLSWPSVRYVVQLNHDSGVGANERNHGTTAAQHT